MIKIPLIICLVIIMLQSVTASLLHRHQPHAMVDSWSEIEVVYYRYFPDAGIHHYRSAGECTLLYKRIKKDRLKIPDVLRCREYIKLLMPTSAINIWKQKQKKQQGYINVNNSEKTENHKNTTTDAHIISIKPVAINSQKLLTGKDTNMVTGLFVQHAVNVRRYTFKDVKTGKTGTINATTNHPFYVKNRSAFIPIEKVTYSDNLITETGQSVKLICQENRKDHCGVAYGNGQPLPVYNLQIAHRHTYFVGKNYKILVHNCTKKKPPMDTLRKVGDYPPDPKLVPFQIGGNCASVAVCSALQEARRWYDIPDRIIKNSYSQLSLIGSSENFIPNSLGEAGIRYEYYISSPGANLINDLLKENVELAMVGSKNNWHIYTVIKSIHSPTGYLQLNQPFTFFNRDMRYGVLPDDQEYDIFYKILPEKVHH